VNNTKISSSLWFTTLASGSSGNSSLIGDMEGNHFLVDCGISCKRIVESLSDFSIDTESVKGIFITHEHADHINGLMMLMKKYKISAYEEKINPKTRKPEKAKGLVRHIMTRKGFATGEIGICVVINGNTLPNSAEFTDMMLKVFEGRNDVRITSICVNINKKVTNVIFGEELKCIYGEPYIVDMIEDIKFKISPFSFYQVNPEQTRKLYGKALEFARLTGEEVVWDLYCGIGTISLFLAKKAKEVYGVEIVPAAVENAKENAKLNGIENAYFTVGKAEDEAKKLPKPDVIVVDPPRKGCDEKLLETIMNYKPERVVYVSCDPATLARDLKVLCGDGGYRLDKVQAVGQVRGTRRGSAWRAPPRTPPGTLPWPPPAACRWPEPGHVPPGVAPPRWP